MPYSSIQDLAKNFWTSERTIYSYLKKFSGKIRTRKENWSLVIHFNDFFWITSNRLKKFYHASQWIPKKTSNTAFWSSEVQAEELPKNFTDKQNTSQNFWHTSQPIDESPYLETIQAIEAKYEKLQSSLTAIQSENQQLEKARNNFENKANEYAIMYKEEQAEKKIREGKFLDLQETHTTFRIKMERFVTSLIVVLVLFLLIFALLYFLGAISLEILQN